MLTADPACAFFKDESGTHQTADNTKVRTAWCTDLSKTCQYLTEVTYLQNNMNILLLLLWRDKYISPD